MGLFDRFSTLFKTNLDVTGRFELMREAIAGTMSDVYKARDKKTGEIVALKILDPEKNKLFEDRFKGLAKPAEGQIAMAMLHPLIVKTLDYGLTTKGQNYVLMEFLDGPGLQTLIRTRSEKLIGNRLRLVTQMMEAIDYVHKQGYIHRDICPRNFICTPECDGLKLIDFGLTVPATKEFMQPGNRTGTPLYMAPEVVRRRPTDQRLDLFSFGVTAYQTCSYELPWPVSDTTGKAALAHDTKAPRPLLEWVPNLHPVLAEVIMQCLESEPERRPESAEAVCRRLKALPSETV